MIITEKKKQVKSPEDIAVIFRSVIASEHITDQSKEHFWVMGLSNKSIVLYIELVSLGTLDSTLVHPREVFRLSIMKACSKIVLVHNHPGNCPLPSKNDETITKRLAAAGEVVGIKVLDHIIICEDSHYSFQTEGKLNIDQN